MSVGLTFIPTVLAACVAPNVAHFAKWPVKLLQMRVAKTSALTQRQLNQAYEGPPVELSERYGAMLSAVFTVLMYAPGMPLLYIFAVIYFILAYWADKITLLEIFKRPGTLDSTLVRAAADNFQWGIYLHLGFATWMFGALHGLKLYVPMISEIADAGLNSRRPGEQMSPRVFLTLVTDRIRNLPGFVPFALLLSIMARDILKAFLQPAWRFSSDWWARRKRQIERKKIMEMRRKAGYDEEEDDDEDDDRGGGNGVKGSLFSYTEALEYEELQGIESYGVDTYHALRKMRDAGMRACACVRAYALVCVRARA